MALPNYPNNPSVNDTFVNGGVTFQWDGEKWKALSNANNSLTAQLADPDSTVLVGGVEAFKVANRVFPIFSAKEFGLKGDGSDETAQLDALILAFNDNSSSQYLLFEKGKTYKYNGSGLFISSDKTVDGNFAEFITDTSDLLFLTEGTFDNHSKNIEFLKIKTTGFSDPLQLLFCDNSYIGNCICSNAGNIGIQVKGDGLIGNVVERCEVDGAGFHCFATNDSLAFDPSHTSQGLRYPKDTTFRDNIAKNASALAYNVHSSSEGGITRVIGGRVENCNQMAKNGFGSQLYSGINIIKSNAPIGTTWFWQVGANNLEGDPNASCTITDCVLEVDQPESLFLLQGNCSISNNVVVYNGAENTQLTYFQINNNVNTESIEVCKNVFRGNGVQYSSSNLLNDNGANNIIKSFKFEGNVFENTISLLDFSDAAFDFTSSTFDTLSISDNSFVFSGASARFALFSGTTINRLRITGNSAEGNRDVVLFSGGDVGAFYFKNNDNIGFDNRASTVVRKAFSSGNLPRSFQTETPSSTSGSATRLVTDFENGAEYRVTLSTDLSNSGSTFLTMVEYTVLVSRDGLSLVSGSTTKAGAESNIGAQFQIAGNNIEYWVATSVLHYINVEKVNDR